MECRLGGYYCCLNIFVTSLLLLDFRIFICLIFSNRRIFLFVLRGGVIWRIDNYNYLIVGGWFILRYDCCNIFKLL